MKILLVLFMVACSTKKIPKAPAYTADFVKVEEHMRIQEELLSPGFSPRFTNEGVQDDKLVVIGRSETLALYENPADLEDRNVLVDRAEQDGLRRLMDYGKMSWMKTTRRRVNNTSLDTRSIHILKGIKGRFLQFVDFECVSRLVPSPDLKQYLQRECRTLHRFPLELLPSVSGETSY
jgi:hypothetical protein